MKEIIKGSRIVFKSLNGKKKPLKEEKKTIAFAFASVVSTIEILKGDKLSKKNIYVRRPGNGDYKVNDLEKLYGKKVKINIRKNVQIKRNFIL